MTRKKNLIFFFVSFFKGKKNPPLNSFEYFSIRKKTHTHIVNRIKDDVEREREDLYCVWYYYYEEVVVRK